MSAVRSRKITKLQTNYALQQESLELTSTKKRKLLYRRLTVFFLMAGLISFFMISTHLSQLTAIEEKEKVKKQLEKQLSGLEKKQQILEEEVIKLNDDEYIAKLARKEYFLSEKDEIIFNLPEKQEENSSH
ncbi:septum formation initiator family protein [Bacillus sp. CGMCC 1.16607]|uniref:FtsB family cell division protein n=1 Tax=Bacillus sp. CGMCC 1.16607 TaxID=3351842 RepID=UPI00363FC065